MHSQHTLKADSLRCTILPPYFFFLVWFILIVDTNVRISKKSVLACCGEANHDVY